MFSRIINSGVDKTEDFYQKREAKILNTFALIIVAGLLIGSTNYFFLGELYPLFVEILVACIALLIPFFNYRKWYDASAYLFVISLNATLFFITKYYDSSTDTFLFYFPFIFCVALLHNPNKPYYRSFIFFALILISFVSSQFTGFSFSNTEMFSEEQNTLLRNYNILFCVILTVFLVYTFIQMLNKKYIEISKLLVETSKDKEIIANSLKEKETLLSEIQHRVKNNLAIISALFNFQKDMATNEEIKRALSEAQSRVMSISMVHEQLTRKDNLSIINIKDYLNELSNEILRTYPLYNGMEIESNIEEISLDISTAVPIGLIVNEVVNNSFKHGFKGLTATPAITLQLQKTATSALLSISDNGKGFPENPRADNNSLGLTLVESLANQIDGTVSFTNENGARVVVQFPLN